MANKTVKVNEENQVRPGSVGTILASLAGGPKWSTPIEAGVGIVQSITGPLVDNTDPKNPVIIPGAGAGDMLSSIYDPTGGERQVAFEDNVFNVKNYGATGDGSTDDTTAIQAAIDESVAENGSVFIPAGEYRISTIELSSNVKLSGAGPQTILKALDNNGANNLITAENAVNVIISDLAIDGNKANQADDGGVELARNSVLLDNVSDSLVKNLTIVDSAKTGILLTGASHHVIVTGNRVSNSKRNGIYLHWSGNHDNVVSNNIVSGSETFHGINLSNSHRNTIIGNTVTSNAQDGLDIDGDSESNVLVGNTASENEWAGITIRGEGGQPKYNLVTGNTASKNQREGIRLEGGAHNQVVANSVNDNSQEAANYYAGIRLDTEAPFNSPEYNVIDSNKISGSHSYGIEITSDGSHNTVLNNVTTGVVNPVNDAGTQNILSGNFTINGSTVEKLKEAVVIDAPSGEDSLTIKTNGTTRYTFNKYGELIGSSGLGWFYDSNVSMNAFSALGDLAITSGIGSGDTHNIRVKASGAGKISLESEVDVPAPNNSTNAATKAYVDTQGAVDRNRANHTGTQGPSTIAGNDGQFVLGHVGGTIYSEIPITSGIGAGTVPLRRSSGDQSFDVPTPTNPNNVANKAYVDSVAGGGGSGDVVGPAVAAADSIVIYDGTSGKLVKSVGVLYQDIATVSDGQTLTNKRITPRVSSTASASSLTPTIANYDQYIYTALAANLTITAPTGTPVDGNKLLFVIKDNGTSRTLTWNAAFTPIGVTLPTATTAGKWLYVGAVYNSAAGKWHVIASVVEA